MRYVLLILIILACYSLNFAQAKQGKDPLEITSDDFSRSRGLTDDLLGGKSVFVFKKPTYKLKRVIQRKKPIAAQKKTPAATEKASYKLPVDTTSAEVWKRLGVTIWRLASDKRSVDAEQDAATIKEAGASQSYVPTRVSAETVFALDDRVRLSFESPDSGYLYVIDREIYVDGTVGEPILIFPTMLARSGNNLIQAGQMVDVPAQSDRVPFFTLDSRNKNWRGEMLTVIISPTPLKDVEIPDSPSRIAASFVSVLEDNYLKNVREYEHEGSTGKAYTRTEKEAGGSLTRELTQKDPFPQTMFRVKMRQREPMLVSFGLTVK